MMRFLSNLLHRSTPIPQWMMPRDRNPVLRTADEFAPKRAIPPPPPAPTPLPMPVAVRRPPPVTLGEVAAGLRAMTYESFINFADNIGADRDKLWKWASAQ
jgi:hypothetical protein